MANINLPVWTFIPLLWDTLLHISLLSTFCSQEYFSSQHSLLRGTLCFLEHFAFCVLESKVCCREHFTKEQSVPGSKVFQGSKCVEEQNLLSMSLQSVPRRKVFWGAKCVSALLTAPRWAQWDTQIGVSVVYAFTRSENEKFPSEVPYLLVFPDASFYIAFCTIIDRKQAQSWS